MKTIALLIFSEFQLLDVAGPVGAFEMPMRGVSPTPYQLKIIAREASMIRSSSGIALPAESFAHAGPIDTLIISGGSGVDAECASAGTLAFVKAAALSARRVCSVCSGAVLLAAAGLLDGRRATTHWRRTRRFQSEFPRVILEPDRIYVRDGPYWTSAGITAGIDLALALIAEDLGEEVARRTAQMLVVYHRRPGGQSQFSALLDIERPNGRFAGLLDWARAHLGEPLGVERLAEQAAMSARNFARAFRAETGVTPAKAIEQLRLEVARGRIESTSEPLDQIAMTTGFQDPERMRRAFVRAFGQPPQGMRRAVRRS